MGGMGALPRDSQAPQQDFPLSCPRLQLGPGRAAAPGPPPGEWDPAKWRSPGPTSRGWQDCVSQSMQSTRNSAVRSSCPAPRERPRSWRHLSAPRRRRPALREPRLSGCCRAHLPASPPGRSPAGNAACTRSGRDSHRQRRAAGAPAGDTPRPPSRGSCGVGSRRSALASFAPGASPKRTSYCRPGQVGRDLRQPPRPV